MSWKLYRWTWQLRSPLHIGTTPAGSLNRTRLYIPARTLWAALTAEIARRRSTSSFPCYQQIGQELREQVRFSYLFPAERVNDRWWAWLPRYEQGKDASGLLWYRENGKVDPMPDRPFRQRLLDTRAGTAIAPGSGAAEEGSLREFEYVMPFWRTDNSSPELQPVAFVGYVFLKEGRTFAFKDFENVQVAFIGGELRYGFGRLTLIFAAEEECCFGIDVRTHESEPLLKNPSYLLAHASLSGTLKGGQEMVNVWDKGSLTTDNPAPLWVPGSSLEDNLELVILPSGHWAKR